MPQHHTGRPHPFHAFGSDLTHAARTILAAPGFAFGVVASLTLGLAATTTAFSVMNAAVFRPFPGVAQQEGLVGLRVETPSRDVRTSYAEFKLLEQGITGLTGLAAAHWTELAVGFPDGAVMVNGALVSGSYFQVLGMRPAAGRFFTPDEDVAPGAHPVVVISDDAWRRHFNRDPGAVGRSLLVNGRELQIVGVAAPGFTGVQKGGPLEIWTPLAMGELALRDAARRPVRVADAGPLWLAYVGRRRPGVSLEQLESETALVAQRIDAGREGERRGARSWVSRVWLNDPGQNVLTVLGFMVVPLLVLAVSCVNTANLLLARANQRTRDWHVRLALGASRWRIVRQVLAESLLLASAAAIAGVGFAVAALRLIESAMPMPFLFPIDWRVLLFTLVVIAATAIGCGAGPALHASSRRAADLYGSARAAPGGTRSRAVLIALQAALSLGLLATGVQFMKTVTAAQASETPDPDRLFIASFDLDPLGVDRQAADEFYTRLLQRARLAPGVTGAAVSLPGLLGGWLTDDPWPRAWMAGDLVTEGRAMAGGVVEGDYFAVAGISLLAGRPFAADDATPPMRNVIVSEALARRANRGAPLGSRFRLGAGPSHASGFDVTVVGIVSGNGPFVYLPAPLGDTPARALYVRTRGPGQFGRETLQGIVAGIDPRVPIREAVTLEQMLTEQGFERRLMAQGVAILGVVALVLAAGGLFAVVSYLVALRRHEIGIRMALGATGRSVTRLILRQALTPAMVGALLGAGGAAATGIIVRSRLHGAAPVDPVALVIAAAMLLLAAIVASLLPARQAAHVNPIVVLREE